MKQFALLIFCLTASAHLCAAPVGNAAAPQLIQEGFFLSSDFWVDGRAGYEGDFIFDARMEQTNGARVDCYKQDSNSGTLTLNFLDRIDLYGVFGSSRTCASWRFTDMDDIINRVEIETFYDFLWGVGVRGILFEWGCASLGLGARYENAYYEPSWLAINAINVSTAGTRLEWEEWQVDLNFSYQIELLTPYIGLKYSRANTSLNGFDVPIASNGAGSNHFENRDQVGIFIGCSISNGKYFMLNIEGRLVDEEAVTISGDIRF
jgi:major outer membrane protein